ncbi:MAG TPA: hypothetical protein VNF47_09140 [Streptosporangiaceae bacterium]|nr:hypothetical protein [Streptosporangiaceae bacterium]
MVALLLIVAGLVASVPLVAAVLVSVASMREDSSKTLSGSAPGMARAAARRILSYRSELAHSKERGSGLRRG